MIKVIYIWLKLYMYDESSTVLQVKSVETDKQADICLTWDRNVFRQQNEIEEEFFHNPIYRASWRSKTGEFPNCQTDTDILLPSG